MMRILIGINKTRPCRCWILATYIENDQNWKSTFQQIVAQLHFLKHIYLIFLSSFDQKKHNVHNILQDSRLLAVIQLWYIPLVNNQNHQYFGLGLIPILKLKPKLVNTFGYRLTVRFFIKFVSRVDSPNMYRPTKGQITLKSFFSGRGFSQKTNGNTSHTSKNEFICSFFGRILGLAIFL